MPPTVANSKRRPRRVRERPLFVALLMSLGVVVILSIAAFEIDLHWPNTPLNNLWALLMVNGQVRPDNPMIAQLIGKINQQDLIFISSACLLGGGVVLGRLASRRSSRGKVLGAAAGAAGTIVVLCLVLAWSLQLWVQQGHLQPHQIDALLVGTQLGWAVCWVLIYMAGALLGLYWRDRQRSSEHNTTGETVPANLRS